MFMVLEQQQKIQLVDIVYFVAMVTGGQGQALYSSGNAAIFRCLSEKRFSSVLHTTLVFTCSVQQLSTVFQVLQIHATLLPELTKILPSSVLYCCSLC
jgi:hypothetical protein